MMETREILALYDREQRINIKYPDTRRERRPHVIRHVSETGGKHFILHSDLAGADVEGVIAEEQAYFGPLGEVEWKVYAHDRPADLRQRLVARGFEVDETEAVMVLDLEETHRLDVSPLPEGVTVRRLVDASELWDVRRIEEAVWGGEFPWVTENLAADMAMPGYLSVYVVYVGEQPATAGWIYYHANGIFADLWGGATLPEHRKKGLFSAVLAARVQEAGERGYRFLIIDAGPMSQPIVARHGFRQLTTAWACNWGK